MAKRDNENGYAYTDRLFKMIGKSPGHELPLEEAIDYIKFYGLIDLMKAQGRIGFDGCSFHAHCKICNKEITMDSQGNWF